MQEGMCKFRTDGLLARCFVLLSSSGSCIDVFCCRDDVQTMCDLLNKSTDEQWRIFDLFNLEHSRKEESINV